MLERVIVSGYLHNPCAPSTKHFAKFNTAIKTAWTTNFFKVNVDMHINQY